MVVKNNREYRGINNRSIRSSVFSSDFQYFTNRQIPERSVLASKSSALSPIFRSTPFFSKIHLNIFCKQNFVGYVCGNIIQIKNEFRRKRLGSSKCKENS